MGTTCAACSERHGSAIRKRGVSPRASSSGSSSRTNWSSTPSACDWRRRCCSTTLSVATVSPHHECDSSPPRMMYSTCASPCSASRLSARLRVGEVSRSRRNCTIMWKLASMYACSCALVPTRPAELSADPTPSAEHETGPSSSVPACSPTGMSKLSASSSTPRSRSPEARPRRSTISCSSCSAHMPIMSERDWDESTPRDTMKSRPPGIASLRSPVSSEACCTKSSARMRCMCWISSHASEWSSRCASCRNASPACLPRSPLRCTPLCARPPSRVILGSACGSASSSISLTDVSSSLCAVGSSSSGRSTSHQAHSAAS
mmetsp:Transcript_42012/g.135074  ORF Transcript_42012/g.135074 Transcript_42012/m.135074 type:complete len:319 (-) Transcript_42012:380-1336(-)